MGRYVIGDVGYLGLLQFGCGYILVHPQIPFFYGLIFANWKQLVLVLHFECADAAGVTFQIDIAGRFWQIPYFDDTIIAAGYNFGLRRCKFDHSDARLMFSNNVGFVVSEIVGYLGEFYIEVVGAGDKTPFVVGPV